MERLTLKEQNELKAKLLVGQGYQCEICKMDLRRTESRNICLDHDHKTGIIRGVLCRGCNGSEGKIMNLATRYKKGLTQLAWLKNLVAYLEKHRVPQTEYLHSTHRSPTERRELRNRKAREKRAQARK